MTGQRSFRLSATLITFLLRWRPIITPISSVVVTTGIFVPPSFYDAVTAIWFLSAAKQVVKDSQFRLRKKTLVSDEHRIA